MRRCRGSFNDYLEVLIVLTKIKFINFYKSLLYKFLNDLNNQIFMIDNFNLRIKPHKPHLYFIHCLCVIILQAQAPLDVWEVMKNIWISKRPNAIFVRKK